MSSRREQKERLRRERLAREQAERAAQRRRRRLSQLGAAAVLAVVVVGTAVLITQAGSEDRTPPAGGELAADARAVERLLAGVPQDGIAFGDPDAPATLIEFVDLQCPFCAQWARAVLPTVVDRYVRSGRLRLELRTLAFLGPDSERAARLAAAAAQQDRMWQLVELFFRNQGTENSGYVTEEFLRRLARSTPGLDAERALAARDAPAVTALLARAERAAARLGVRSTPSFFIARPGEAPRRLDVPALTPEAFTEALDQALAERP